MNLDNSHPRNVQCFIKSRIWEKIIHLNASVLRCAVAAFRLLLKELEYGESHSACVQQGVTPRGRPYQTPFAPRERPNPETGSSHGANGDVSLPQQGFQQGLFPANKDFNKGYSLPHTFVHLGIPAYLKREGHV